MDNAAIVPELGGTMTPPSDSTPVSIVLIARDASRTLARCLDSTQGFDDVLLMDTGSADDTLTIARRYSHLRVVEGPFVNFSDARNRAAAMARHPWICPLDTDEWLSPPLVAALQSFRPASDRHVHAFWRINWFAGRRLRSALGREWIRRVYHRDHIRFVGAVHERLLLMDDQWPPVAALPGAVEHDPYADVGHLFQKRWFYARPDLRAGLKPGGPLKAMLRGGWRFLRGWLFKGGVIDGWRGFALAAADAYGVFLKYLWAYDAARRDSSDRIKGA